MNSVIQVSMLEGAPAVHPVPQMTRMINGFRVTIRFSPTPNKKVMETVKNMLISSYMEALEKRINEELHIKRSLCA